MYPLTRVPPSPLSYNTLLFSIDQLIKRHPHKKKGEIKLYTLLISLGAILNFQWMTSFAERSYTWPKWLPKMKSLLTLILQCVHIKRNVFTLYQEEYFLYTMSLWVCYRNFKAVVQRYSWIDDIEDKRELI